MKLIDFIVEKIKSLHPKENINYQHFFVSVIWLILFIYLSLHTNNESFERLKLSNNYYAINSHTGRSTFGPYLYTKINGIKYIFYCNLPRYTKLTKELCSKKNEGKIFIGNNVNALLFADNKVINKRSGFILNADFREYDCKNNCQTISIKVENEDLNNYLTRLSFLKFITIPLVIVCLCYLILQIKYRFFNYHKGN